MAKNVVFLIHGIGSHAAGWTTAADGPVHALSKAAEFYSGFSETEPLSAAVEFVEIRYDDIFDGIRERWAALAAALNNNLPPGVTPEALAKVTQVLAQANSDSFIATHVLDVGMYATLTLVQRLVQLKVASQMMKTIASHAAEPEESRKYIVIAHSLGTTVAHDAIQRMATTGWLSGIDDVLQAFNDQHVGEPVLLADMQGAIDRYGKNPFAPGVFKFEAIFQIANTSRLLSKTKDPYNSVVRPMFAAGPLACSVRRFYNVDHILDPIGKFKKHRAKEAWPMAATNFTTDDFFDVNHIHDVNVHGFGHYLAHPTVHANILLAAAPSRFKFTDYQTALARLADDGDFPRFGSQYLDEDLRDNVEGLLTQLSPNTLDELPDGIEEEVRGYLGTLQVPTNVMHWLTSLVALKNVVTDIRGRLPQ